MSATSVVVIVLCAAMIVAGVAVVRLSPQRRGYGAIAIVLGVIGLLAWATAEHGSSPPPNATPTHGPTASTPTADAP